MPGLTIEPALTLDVDLAALVANWRALAHLSRPARTSAVVKADGYGLGLSEVVPALYAAGCRDFFTATVPEGVEARRHAADACIFVLNGIYPGAEQAVAAAELIPVLASVGQIELWAAFCAEGGARPWALHVDTGMNRLGLSPEQALAISASGAPAALPPPALIVSHLACADVPDHPLNRLQLESFQTVARTFSKSESSLCNSAGIFLGGDFLCDLTRPGIALYGGEAVTGAANPMKPVVSAAARILQIRTVARGQPVGYGASERLERDGVIATCAVGYADGYLRSLSGAGVPLRATEAPRAEGWVAGHQVPVRGRVTMDLTMFDITDVPAGSVREGDFIELFGRNLPLDDLARAAGTIGYEILTSIGDRYARTYWNG